jgi:hypothetical protein
MEYHPSSHRPTIIVDGANYTQNRKRNTLPPDAEPWISAFATFEDFELAELALEGCLSDRLLNQLIRIIQRIAAGTGRCTFTSGADIKRGWERASERLAPVRRL